MVGTYWSTFADARVKTKSDSAMLANSSANNSHSSGPISSMFEII